jgi:hypothetical protein
VVRCGDINDFATVGIFLQLLAFLLVTPCVFFFPCLYLPRIGVHCEKKSVSLLPGVRIVT